MHQKHPPAKVAVARCGICVPSMLTPSSAHAAGLWLTMSRPAMTPKDIPVTTRFTITQTSLNHTQLSPEALRQMRTACALASCTCVLLQFFGAAPIAATAPGSPHEPRKGTDEHHDKADEYPQHSFLATPPSLCATRNPVSKWLPGEEFQ